MTGIKTSQGTHNLKKEISKRQLVAIKQKDSCLGIVIDTTRTMKYYIDAIIDNIEGILDSLKQVKSDYILYDGGIVGQVVHYKDYANKIKGETEEYITDDFLDSKANLLHLLLREELMERDVVKDVKIFKEG